MSLRLPGEHSDMDDKRKKWADHVLYQSLKKIFRERCVGSSDQIKEFLRNFKQNDQKSMIKPILELDPTLSCIISQENLGQLSLLWIAVLGLYHQSAELLVRYGADVNEPFGRHRLQLVPEDRTVLHALLRMYPSPENEQLICLVTDHDADLQARDCSGLTVLEFVIKQGRVQISEMFLEKGADVNAAADDGMTPLLFAATSTRAKELIPLLIKHGADISVKDSHGRNVLHYLTENIFKPPIDLARVLIEKGVSLNDKEHRSHFQPIHQAIASTDNKLLELFLDHGANVNALTSDGESPLYLAATKRSRSYTVIMETLLKRGAKVDLRTNRGRTALHAVCVLPHQQSRSFENKANERMIRLLLSAGADVLIEDCDGKTPFALISSDGEAVLEPETCLMIDTLALKKVLQPSIKLKDERIINRNPKYQNYYRKCIEQMTRMKSMRFIHTCTVLELYVKSYCQIAALMRNPNFVTKFKQCDLSGFSTYAGDILQAFKHAQNHYRAMVEQENVINEAVYNILPDLVVDKIVHYIFNCCKNIK